MNRLIAIILMAVVLPVSAEATIGKTFPIQERSMLDEIKETPINPEELRKQGVASIEKTFTSKRGLSVVPKGGERRWSVTPTYTVPFDIVSDKGEVIYPKGYQFNPLAYGQLNQQIIVINDSAEQIQFALEIKKDNAIIMIDGDPRKLSEFPAYKIDQRVISTTKVQRVPTIIEQIGHQLRMTEYAVSTASDSTYPES